MKRYFALLAAAALLLTGCQSDKASSPAEEISTAAPSAEQTTSPADTSAETTPAEEPAVTTAQPTAEASTPEDSTNAEYGIGVPFEYEYGDGNIVFHMGAADNNTIAVPSDIAEDSVTLTWEDGTAENFVFVSDNAENFHFYTNEELVQIAQRYYKANSPEGYVPGMAGTQNNDDGTVTIQLYDSLEDHNSTSAWYTIDRVNLTGTDDMTGSAVIMSDYAEAGTAEG